MNYSIHPTENELREARGIVQGTLEAAKAIQPKEKSVSVGLAWNSHFESSAISSERLILHFKTGENWEEELKNITAQGYAQTVFLENIEPDFHWQELLMLGYSLNFAEDLTGEKPELNEVSEIAEHWDVLQNELSNPVEETSPKMVRYGFSVAYYLVEHLMKDNGLEDLAGLKLSDVVEAGDSVFNE